MHRTVALLVIAALLAGCGTTYVIPNEPNARVYLDGAMVGKGVGQVKQRGFPSTAQVMVQTEDGRRERATVSRSFTAITFLLGFVTYGICWLACWEYPGSVMVSLPSGPAAGGFASNPAATDPWMQPPPGWRPPQDAPAAPK